MRSPNRKTTPTRNMTTSSSWMDYRAPSREICKHPPISHSSSFFTLHFQFRHEQKPALLLSCARSLLVKKSCIRSDERASVMRNTTGPGSTHAVLVKCPGKPRNEIVLVGFRRVAMAESDGKDQQNHEWTTSGRLRRVCARIQTRSFKKHHCIGTCVAALVAATPYKNTLCSPSFLSPFPLITYPKSQCPSHENEKSLGRAGMSVSSSLLPAISLKKNSDPTSDVVLPVSASSSKIKTQNLT